MEIKKGIYVKLHGGIGNQFYQYCFAKYIESIFKNSIIILDTDFYSKIEEQKFPRENVFNGFLSDDSILFRNVEDFKINFVSRITKKLIKAKRNNKFITILNLLFGNYIIENIYTLENLKLLRFRRNKNIYFHGYWQDFKFIEYGINNLKIEFNTKFKYNIIAEKVALHIRRGDYLKISHNGKESIVLGLDYYACVIDYFTSLGYFEYEVFSDDLDWCLINLPKLFPNSIFRYDSKKLNDLECLCFMSSHSNIIVANSTYSLWSFYLSSIEKATIPNDWLLSNQSKGYDLVNFEKFQVKNGIAFSALF